MIGVKFVVLHSIAYDIHFLQRIGKTFDLMEYISNSQWITSEEVSLVHFSLTSYHSVCGVTVGEKNVFGLYPLGMFDLIFQSCVSKAIEHMYPLSASSMIQGIFGCHFFFLLNFKFVSCFCFNLWCCSYIDALVNNKLVCCLTFRGKSSIWNHSFILDSDNFCFSNVDV